MKTEFRDDQYQLCYPEGVENHWWHLARNRLLEQHLRKLSKQNAAILDVGCGCGITVKYLRSKAINCFGVEPAEARPLKNMDQYIYVGKKAEDLPEIERNRYSLLLLLDVVEHIADPGIFLKDLVALFPNLTHVIITVPACPELWSNYDEFYGHYRRYSISMIERLSQQLNWQLVWNFYFFQLLYLPARLITKTGQKRAIEMKAPEGVSKRIHSLISYILTVTNYTHFLGLPGTSITACFSLSKH
ncbi:class I SAM-dependent methyltransferase [Phormidium sp. CLA17]|uniref:class I SAM-dependent methyltransferase n=1 Tax=Leptolyngbya sp. Cla-17 TaxID=2803751 RepID=UPI001491681A|nr:class I SAM-dependent methyltransferase [Leptolyngbya sp. Cla-17]MBM0740839.1 class I SAM-dependent methyltransferase [Leptolyngbya sp. Cla-17]